VGIEKKKKGTKGSTRKNKHAGKKDIKEAPCGFPDTDRAQGGNEQIRKKTSIEIQRKPNLGKTNGGERKSSKTPRKPKQLIRCTSPCTVGGKGEGREKARQPKNGVKKRDNAAQHTCQKEKRQKNKNSKQKGGGGGDLKERRRKVMESHG